MNSIAGSKIFQPAPSLTGPGRPGRLYRRRSRGQTVVEYMLMTLMLLVLFIGLYGTLQKSMKAAFRRAGIMILRAYY